MKKGLIVSILLTTLFLLLVACERTEWAEFKPPDGSFSILMPCSPKYERVTTNAAFGPLEYDRYDLKIGQTRFDVTHAEYPESIVKQLTTEEMLNNARDGILASAPAKLLSEENISLSDYPGRSMKFATTDGKMIIVLRNYVVGNELYALFAMWLANNPPSGDIGKFFDSFKLLTK